MNLQLTDAGRAVARSERYEEVSPSDSEPLTDTPSALFVERAGTVTYRGAGECVDVTLSDVPAGAVLEISPVFVRASGTTAGGIWALYY